MNKELILIDASWVIHRMWHVHNNLSVKLNNGIELKSGHLYGVARLLKSLTIGYPKADILLCLDGMATHGKELNVDYKGGRTPGTVKTAFNDLGVIVECACAFDNTRVAFHRNLEADEVISYFVDMCKGSYEKVIIYSADGDMLQLLGSNVFISKKFERGKLKLIDSEFYYTDGKYVSKFCGCKIESLPLYRAMVGDSSDNLAGFPRIRKKVAKSIAECYASIDELVRGIEEGDAIFPSGFKSFIPTLQNNYEIMKLPGVEDLKIRGTEPMIYEGAEDSKVVEMFSLYRIRSASPVATIEVLPEFEKNFLRLRDDINLSWKHPNSI